MVTLEIVGRFPSLNDYISAERRNRHIAAKMKRDETERVKEAALAAGIPTFSNPVTVSFKWIEPNTRRDVDNVAFAKKFILDGLVNAGVLPSDSRKHVTGLKDDFSEVDKNNPRVVVTIEEVEHGA